MAANRYVPQNIAAAFGQVKATDSTTEYSAIKTAFDAIDGFTVATASMQIGAGSNRNVLVDNTIALNTGNPIIIMLPQSPVVGDPPCRIQLLNGGYATAVGHTATYIQGDNIVLPGTPDPVMGSLTILPRLYGAGDYIELIWLGGTIGWAIANLDIGAYAPVAFATVNGPAAVGGNYEQFTFQGFEVIANAAAFGASLLLRNLPQNRGDRFFFTAVSGCSVAIGRAGGLDTVNGAASPQIFAADHVRKTCVRTGNSGTNTYEVY